MPVDAERVRKKLLDAARNAGYTLAELSRELGRKPGYLRDYVTRYTPKRLDGDDRQKLAAILGIEEDDLKEVVTAQQPGSVAVRKQLTEAHPGWKDFAGAQPSGSDLPLLGRVEGPDGILYINDDVVGGFVDRPANLIGVSNAYAVDVPDSTMFPAFKPGTHVWVNPNKAVHPGNDVVVRLKSGQVLLRTLKRRVETQIVLDSYNPPKETKLSKDEVAAIHLIVGCTRI